jgi:hypothetical protein
MSTAGEDYMPVSKKFLYICVVMYAYKEISIEKPLH